MAFFRKLILLLVAGALLLLGLSLVIMNEQSVTLNVLWLSFPSSNLGLVVLAAFACGGVLGLLLGSSLLRLLRLNNRLYWLRREVKQLQDDLAKKRPR